LEALKEAIRQEVAAITPGMVLKVMDTYREATSVYQYSRPPLSDDLFKTHCCKTAFCVLSRNRKIFTVSFLILKLFASQNGEFFLPHPVLTVERKYIPPSSTVGIQLHVSALYVGHLQVVL